MMVQKVGGIDRFVCINGMILLQALHAISNHDEKRMASIRMTYARKLTRHTNSNYNQKCFKSWRNALKTQSDQQVSLSQKQSHHCLSYIAAQYIPA
jgi:hypothetical protein